MNKRNKLSEMTYVERVDRALVDASWEQAEEAGVEIQARSMELHTYARPMVRNPPSPSMPHLPCNSAASHWQR